MTDATRPGGEPDPDIVTDDTSIDESSEAEAGSGPGAPRSGEGTSQAEPGSGPGAPA
jgi:hypothetical protein